MPDRINNENFRQGTEPPAFRTLAVNIPGIVYRVYLGERGRMTFFNDMLHQMTGYKADELTMGNICSIDPIILAEDRSSVLQAVNDAIRNNLPFEVEYRIHHKNRSLRYFLEKGRPVYGCDGKPEFIDGIILNITERKQAEETLRELNEELNEYAYALNHNLKAPLRAIHNYVNFLFEDLADSLEDEPKTYLQGIKDAITSSNKQFKDLERLYHIKNRQLNFESFEMLELLDEIKSIFKDTSDQNLVIAQNWPRFRSERFLLRQMLLALINNGLKFNDADIKRIDIGWQAVAGRGIEIFVRDNGIGIDPQYQQQIFDIFRRLHTESEYEGTGIGLAVVKRAVQRIGGKLRLESAVGEGSTFYINLPNSLIENNQA